MDRGDESESGGKTGAVSDRRMSALLANMKRVRVIYSRPTAKTAATPILLPVDATRVHIILWGSNRIRRSIKRLTDAETMSIA